MNPAEYELMYKAEESHWWYVGMAAITKAVLDTFCRKGEGLRILDAGCGTGGAMSWLGEYGRTTGLDLSSHALGFCRRRGHHRTCIGSVMDIPFPDETFDVVVSLDVLYFAGIRDKVALLEFHRVLAPGGRVVLRVPSYNWLRSGHDRRVSTGHRYTRRELGDKMKGNGFEPELLTYVNTFLFPLALGKRALEKWLPCSESSEIAMEMKPFDRILKRFLLLESRIIRRRSLPFGLSIMGMGRKEAESNFQR